MKKKILAVSFLLFIAWCGIAFSDESCCTCYKVKGRVKTINGLDGITQQGRIDIAFFDQNGDKVLIESGYLFGKVMGDYTDKEGVTVTFLKHTATFEDGSMFESSMDEARVVNPWTIQLGEDGSLCYFEVEELIKTIVKGEGIFKNVSSANVVANGYLNTCEGANQNKFELTGEMCFDCD